MKLLESGPSIVWLGHDSFKISGEQVIFIDPFKLEQSDHAGIVLITHNHYDHLSPDDIAKVSAADTEIVAPAECAPKLPGRVLHIIKPGDNVTVKGITIEAVPAYNVNKFRSPGVPFHPKGDGKVGYVVSIGGVRIYHAGDTDFIPEMSNITCDIALLPVSGTYAMTAEEAAQAANVLKAKMSVPMHIGSIVGSDSDAERFQKLVLGPVTIMKKGA